jgi:HAD superfamily hydrolase (TIGR01484 family)
MESAKAKLIVFDLDNTLAVSKTVIDEEMSELLRKLLEIKKVAVISGGSFKQLEKELLFHLSLETNLTNLHIFPTGGTSYYNWIKDEGKWALIYQESLSEKEKIKIIDSISTTLKEINFDKESIKGNLIEDKDSSITFSGLGQDADLNEKVKWDPDQSIRQVIKSSLDKMLPDFEVKIAGTTSIDITAKGKDKAYGIQKMVEYIKVPISEMVYVGDSLFEGGNDHPVIKTGINVLAVKNPEGTKNIIRNILNNK